MGVARSRAERMVDVDDGRAGTTQRRRRTSIATRIAVLLERSKVSRATRDALYDLACDASLTYREAAKAHGITVAAVYRASRLIPEIREARRHRQWGAS